MNVQESVRENVEFQCDKYYIEEFRRVCESISKWYACSNVAIDLIQVKMVSKVSEKAKGN